MPGGRAADDLTNNGEERAPSSSGARASAAYARISEDERPFSLRDVAQTIRKRLWVIVLVTLVFLGAALAFSRWQTPVYEASAQLLVRQEQQADDQKAKGMEDAQVVQQLAQTVLAATDSRPVAEETIRRLGLQMDPGNLLRNLTAEQLGSTPFIQLTYEDADPERAREIVDAVSRVSSEQISQMNTSASGVTAKIWQDATVSDTPVSPDPAKNAALALALGLMFGTGLAFVTEYLGGGWRSPDHVERVSGVPALGVVPRFEITKAKAEDDAKTIKSHRRAGSVSSQEDEQRNGFSGGLVAAREPAGVASEAYRVLRTKLLYPLAGSPPKVIVLTSADRREGRTTTAANLGATLAQAGNKVLVVDCDLRNPALHRMLGLKNTRGLANILLGEQRAQEVWQEPIPGLKLISAGPLPPDPTDLLSSRRLTQLLEEMRQEFDYVLVDTPPVGPADSFVLTAHADAVLLIVHSERTRKEALQQALRDLQSVEANVLGTVVNGFGAPQDGYYSNLRHEA